MTDERTRELTRRRALQAMTDPPTASPGKRRSLKAALVVPAQPLRDRAGAHCVFRIELQSLQRLGFSTTLFIAAPSLIARRNPGDAEELRGLGLDLGADDVVVIRGTKPFRALRSVVALLGARLRGRWA